MKAIYYFIFVSAPFAMQSSAMEKETRCQMADQMTLKTRLSACFEEEIHDKGRGFNAFKIELNSCKVLPQLARRKLTSDQIEQNASCIIDIFFRFIALVHEQTAQNKQCYHKKYTPMVVAALLKDHPEALAAWQAKKKK